MAILLLLLAAGSGLVDAASYLKFGHVFVANMTGNIVFIGFALAGASGFSLISSLVAVLSFAVGALLCGRLLQRQLLGKPAFLRLTSAIECILVIVGIAIGATGAPEKSVPAYAVVALLAVAMGMQSAMTTRLRIGGFNSTVVLTTMLGTLASNSRLAGADGRYNGRRMLAISCMFGGGLVGAILALRVSRLAPLIVTAVLLVIAAVSAHLLMQRVDSTTG
jgi:uncharacterized membrane protein YoaK (UPF0700 family)